MFFNSIYFGFFFAVVVGIVWLLRKNVAGRNLFLLAASYFFYGCWDYRFLGLIVISTLVDYLCGLAFDVHSVDAERAPLRTRRHRFLLLASLVTNLGLLGFFKYFNFFVDSAQSLLTSIGLPIDTGTLNIVLPVGISFYTFQTLSYTIDLYRGRVTTERNLLNFALYVAFFPQLVAGPIERAKRLLPQMRVPSRITWEGVSSGFYLIGWGLFKKVVIADNIGKVADVVFNAPNASGLEVIIGVYAFAVQIYCDFSAYSDIARGTARILGFELMLNFNLPYFATNPSDFWRRWHISLSTWLRDYLYIAVGGNQRGSGRTYANLMFTMILGGLWHGAAWTFVAWGVFHGLLLAGHRMTAPWMKRHLTPTGALAREIWHWVRVIFFFQLVCVSWLLFRADSIQQAYSMLGTVFTDPSLALHVLNRDHMQIFLSCWVVFWGAQLLQWFKGDLKVVLRFPFPVRALAYAAGILGFLWFGEYGGQAFIYFQF